MKAVFVVFLALAVAANAFPQEYELEYAADRNQVETQIRDRIDKLIQRIRELNLDPVQINKLIVESQPRPGVEISLLIERLTFAGLSNIKIEELRFSLGSNRLILILSLPKLSFSLGNSRLDVKVHKNEYTGEFNGECVITSIRFTLDARIDVNIITGISIRSLEATGTVQNIWSDFTLVLLGVDWSDRLNLLVNKLIPDWIDRNQNTINRVLSFVLKTVGNYLLP